MTSMVKLSQQEPFTSYGADTPENRPRELTNFRIYQNLLHYLNNQLEFD